MKKIKSPVCPNCGKKLAYAGLWDERKYETGHCSYCGAKFEIYYPPSSFLLLTIVTVCTLFVSLLSMFISKNGSVSIFLLPIFLIVYIAMYFYMPTTIQPTLVKETTPAKRRAAVQETPKPASHYVEAAPSRRRAGAPVTAGQDKELEKTVVMSRVPRQQRLAPEERYRQTQRSGNEQISKTETEQQKKRKMAEKIRRSVLEQQQNQDLQYQEESRNQRMSSLEEQKRKEEERNFFEHY